LPEYWAPYNYGKYNPGFEVDTGLGREKLAEITAGLIRPPAGFHVHPKIVKLLEQRGEMGQGKRPVDYGFAELLAFGSLVLEGNPVRLTGQDSQRGTFNQRHAILVDTQTEPGEIAPVYGTVWPVTRYDLNVVTVSYTAGYGAAPAVPEDIKVWLKQAVAYRYDNRSMLTQLPASFFWTLAQYKVVWKA